VRYEPSEPDVVEIMLRMGEVNAGDVVYDLGCGDGRIPIAAARRGVARAVCVELDPVRILKGRERARQAGVEDKVTFVEGDLFEADLSDATVVTLYLLPELNLRLRPKLQALRPGTRIVSHNFDMGDWPSRVQREVDGHTLYLWSVRGPPGAAAPPRAAP
jgi:SAM-dependent methyltransferase